MDSRGAGLRARASTAIAGGGHCTHTEIERFFSWRADKDAGRMATLVWLAPEPRAL